MIASFADKATETLYHGRASRQARRFPPAVLNVIHRKFDMLNAAQTLQDLRSPPGNRLEALRGNLAGFYSIRVNDQWRLVFRWEGSDVHDLRLTDCH